MKNWELLDYDYMPTEILDEHGRAIYACDESYCRALKSPASMDQMAETIEHLSGHSLLGGCSHGR